MQHANVHHRGCCVFIVFALTIGPRTRNSASLQDLGSRNRGVICAAPLLSPTSRLLSRSFGSGAVYLSRFPFDLLLAAAASVVRPRLLRADGPAEPPYGSRVGFYISAVAFLLIFNRKRD